MAEPGVDADLAPRRWSLVARLTTWYTLAVFVTVLVVAVSSYVGLERTLDREDDVLLADKLHTVGSVLWEQPGDVAELRQEVAWGVATRTADPLFIRILDPAGGPAIETPGMADHLPRGLWHWPPSPAQLSTLSPSRDLTSPTGRSYRVASGRLPVGPSGRQTRIVQIALDRSQESAALARYRSFLLLLLALALALSAAIGHQLARRGVRPVEAMARSARRIHSGTLDERLSSADMPAELHDLAETFNGTLDRLETAFARLSRFSADIAHELRTPIQNLRGEAEVALSRERTPEHYREVLSSTLEECGKLSRLIDSLLFLARSESPETRVEPEPLVVSRELRAVEEFYEAAASERRVVLEVRCAEHLQAEWDRALVQRALGNLISNALAHTPCGGRIALVAEAERDGVTLSVTDTGEGIPEQHLPHVFDRFFRADGSRSASSGRVGLGLAIVKGIATLHGGSVQIRSRPGEGTRVALWLPQRHYSPTMSHSHSARSTRG